MKVHGLVLAASALIATCSPRAFAEEAPGVAAATRAAELYKQANASYDAGKLDDAEKLYREAWQLSRSYDIASNLGAVAFDRAKYRDAAEYLTFALANFPAGGKPAERTNIQTALKRAKEHVFTLRIGGGPPRARVLIDGAAIGELPLAAEVFLDPGKHVVEVKSDGYQPKQTTVIAVAGTEQDFQATLDALPAAPGARKEVLIAGGALAAGALVGGITLVALSAEKSSEAEKLRAELVTSNGRRACEPPAAVPQCKNAQEALEARDAFGNAGVWLLIGAGAAAAGTATYYFATRSGASVSATAAVGPTQVGFSLRGAW